MAGLRAFALGSATVAAPAHEMPRIEAAAQVAVGDRLPGARGVDEAPAAGVDPDVVDAAPADAKEYQVPRGERRERHRVCRALLLGRGAGNDQARALVNVARQSAASGAEHGGTHGLRPGCGKAKSTVAGAHGDVAAPRHADIPERVPGTARGRLRVLPFLTARRAPTVAAPVRALKRLPLMVVAALLAPAGAPAVTDADRPARSEEHTAELQSPT